MRNSIASVMEHIEEFRESPQKVLMKSLSFNTDKSYEDKKYVRQKKTLQTKSLDSVKSTFEGWRYQLEILKMQIERKYRAVILRNKFYIYYLMSLCLFFLFIVDSIFNQFYEGPNGETKNIVSAKTERLLALICLVGAIVFYLSSKQEEKANVKS